MRPRNSRTSRVAALVLLIALCAPAYAQSNAQSNAEAFENAFGLSNAQPEAGSGAGETSPSEGPHSELEDLEGAPKDVEKPLTQPAREEAEDEYEVDKLADVEVHQDPGSGTISNSDGGGSTEAEGPKGLSPRILGTDETSAKYVRYGKGNDVCVWLGFDMGKS